VLSPGRQPQLVGCKVYRSAAYNVPSGSLPAIPWDAEAWDTHGFHDKSTNPTRLTVPAGQAGFYSVKAGWAPSAAVGTGTNRVVGRIVKNGTPIPGGITELPGGAFSSPHASTEVYLDEGDIIEYVTYQDTGGNVALEVSMSGLSLTKIGPPLNSV
jgi:hypothetical protein